MIGTFRTEPEASAELEDAAMCYESQRPGLGLELVQAVDFALAPIAEWPQIGRRITRLPNDLPVRKLPVEAIRLCTYRRKAHFGFWHLRSRLYSVVRQLTTG